MKKAIIIGVLTIVLLLSGCAQNTTLPQTDSQNDSNSASSGYVFAGKTEAVHDDRRFELQDTPENESEELVANSYRCEITCEFDQLSSLYGDNDSLKISAANTKSNYEKGIYIKELIIHSLSTISEEELSAENFASASNMQADVEKYGLTDFTVVLADFSIVWSEKALSQGPQTGNGRHSRFFLCGKNNGEDDWKIYEIYWD